jgi:uncharacterized C2H2 Zn-finger protein
MLDEIGFYDCPVCKRICLSEDDRHRHLEEKHNNLIGQDEELLEKTSGKEILNG